MRRGRALLLAAALAGAASCGGAREPGGAGDLDAAARALGLLPADRLAAFVPAVDGWTRGAVRTATIGLPAVASHVAAAYTGGGARIDLELTDTGGQAAFLEGRNAMAGTSFDQQVANGYVRGTTLAGFPALESWNRDDRLAELTVILAGRFIVSAGGSGLDDIDALRRFVERIDLARLAEAR